MKVLAKFVGGVFFAVWILAGLILFFYYWQVLTGWLGGILGNLVMIFTAPGVVVFPLVYWFVQGAFPTFYFELLGIGLGSAMLSSLLWSVGSKSSKSNEG